MECVSSIQTCNGARGGEAIGSGTDLGSIAAKLCHVHRKSGSNEVFVACVTKDNALLCWEGSGSNLILSVHLPSLDKSSFKSSASMKGIQMYDRSEDRRGGGSEVALLTDHDLVFVRDDRLGARAGTSEQKTRTRHLSNKAMGTGKALASLGIVRPHSLSPEGRLRFGDALAVVGCGDSTVKVVHCGTLAVALSLDFAKSSVPSMLCGSRLVPARSAITEGTSASALFAASSDGHICSWLLDPEHLAGAANRPKPVSARPSCSFKIGKAGILGCEIGRSPGACAPVEGDPTPSLYGQWLAYAFTKDGKLSVIRCVDGGGRLVLGKGVQQDQAVLATIDISSGVNFSKEKKLEFHCALLQGGVLAFTASSAKQRKSGPQRVNFSKVRVEAGDPPRLEPMAAFEVERALRGEARAAGKKSSQKEEFRVLAMAAAVGGGGLVIGTSAGWAALTGRFSGTSTPAVISGGGGGLTILRSKRKGGGLDLERIQPASAAAQKGDGVVRACARAVQTFCEVPGVEGLGGADLQFSPSRRFLRILSGGCLHAFAVSSSGLHPIAHSLGRVDQFAWCDLDESVCACSSQGQVRLLRISLDGRIEVTGSLEAATAAGGVSSLSGGPRLGVTCSSSGDAPSRLDFYTWRGERAVGENLEGAVLPEPAFVEWNRIEPGFPRLCAVGYSNAIVILALSRSGVCHLGSVPVSVSQPVSCLWRFGGCLLVGTSEEIFAAYVSAAESQGEEAGLLTIPPEMRPRQGLCERASLTDQDPNFADAAAAIGGPYSLLWSGEGSVWCSSADGDVFAVDLAHLSVLDRLKTELGSPEFPALLERAQGSLSAEDRKNLICHVSRLGLVASNPQVLGFASTKAEQIWALYASDRAKALQLAIHYVTGAAEAHGSHGSSVPQRSLREFRDLLGVSREVFMATREEHGGSARAKMEECLAKMAGGALGETTARVFAGTGIHKGDGGDLGTFLRGLAGTANN